MKINPIKWLKRIGYNQIEKVTGLYAVGQILKHFNSFINECDKALVEKKNYSNHAFWKNHGLSLDSQKDKQFCREFAIAIEKKAIKQWHLDYISGEGAYEGNGLRDYVWARKKEILTKAINKWGVNEKEIIAEADTQQKNAEFYKSKIPKNRLVNLKKQQKELENYYDEVV